MAEADKLIFMGEKIASNFQDKIKQGGELSAWRQECALSCEILLDYLRASPTDIEKILLLANTFQEKYTSSKPPVIPHWCRKISESLSPNQ